MTRRRPRAFRASRMRSWSSSGPAATTGSGSAIWAIGGSFDCIGLLSEFVGLAGSGRGRYHRDEAHPMPTRRWQIPEGLRVLPDGSWRVGELQVLHPPTLRYLKAHLVEEAGTP